MNNPQITRVTLVVNHLLSKRVHTLLCELAIPVFFYQHARRGLLNFNTLSAKIFGHPKLTNDRMEVFVFYLPVDYEHAFYQRAINDLDLTSPGHGSVFSQHLSYFSSPELAYQPILCTDHASDRLLSTHVHGITLITGRGEADSISYEVMRNGYIPPHTLYGTGMGNRQKLGLTRITIPQEKEVLSLMAYCQDVPILLDILHKAARLDLPGKGFLYHYPIDLAKIDTKTRAQMDFHTASTDQMIAAIDSLMNNTDWRRKSSWAIETHFREKLFKQTEMDCLQIYVPYGKKNNITELSFQFGVRGATMVYYRSMCYQEGKNIPDKDYYVYTMVMPTTMVQPLLQHLQNNNEEIAFTYSHRVTLA